MVNKRLISCGAKSSLHQPLGFCLALRSGARLALSVPFAFCSSLRIAAVASFLACLPGVALHLGDRLMSSDRHDLVDTAAGLSEHPRSGLPQTMQNAIFGQAHLVDGVGKPVP